MGGGSSDSPQSEPSHSCQFPFRKNPRSDCRKRMEKTMMPMMCEAATQFSPVTLCHIKFQWAEPAAHCLLILFATGPSATASTCSHKITFYISTQWALVCFHFPMWIQSAIKSNVLAKTWFFLLGGSNHLIWLHSFSRTACICLTFHVFV